MMRRRIIDLLLLLSLLWGPVEPANARYVRRRAQDCLAITAGGLQLPAQVPGHIQNLGELIPLIGELGVDEGDNPGFDTFKVFKDFDDAAIVAKRGSACYVTFRATIPINPLDIWQLYNFRKETIGTCRVRKGFSNAYYSSYYDEFVDEVNQCMSGDNTELVLGGHSQGASIAVVASIDFRHYDPTVITFGAIRTLVEPCSDVNPLKHYRFINAASGVYDDWTMRFNQQVHVGHAFLLDPQASTAAAYLGLNDDQNRSPSSKDFHHWKYSFEALSKLLSMNCPSLRVAGWENDHWCTRDEECLGSCVNSMCKAWKPYSPTTTPPPQPTSPPTPVPTPPPNGNWPCCTNAKFGDYHGRRRCLSGEAASGNPCCQVCLFPPTPSPTTKQPSPSPTPLPTSPPTSNPTKNPTSMPTESPTPNPTQHPTRQPTPSPMTSKPSPLPSLSPSQAPSTTSSKSPSFTPCDSPSVSPSREPTPAPSVSPSETPSSSPSQRPSLTPIYAQKFKLLDFGDVEMGLP